MLSEARAARLARRAGRRRADGRGGALARRAWQTLSAAGDRGDGHAVEAVWQAWLRDPDDDFWAALGSWREPATLAESAFAAAVEPDRDAAGRAAIGAFCARRGLAPEDPIEQALFLVLTAQQAQHRAADPDGSLIGAAYQGASVAGRAALRQAVAGAGDLDLVRVVGARQPDRTAQLTATEYTYLTSQLAARRDWAGLWRLTTELPLTDAVATVRRFDGGWRPEDDRGRELFDRLSHADPGQLARARDALTSSEMVRVATPGKGPVTRGAMSADGRRLAVTTLERGRYLAMISIFDLPNRTLIERCGIDAEHYFSMMAYAGYALIVSVPGLATQWSGALRRYANGRFEPFADLGVERPGSLIFDLAPWFTPGGGLAVLCSDCVVFCDADGGLAGTIQLPGGLGIPRVWRAGEYNSPLLATEPGGRAAVAGGRGGLAVFDAQDVRHPRLLACEPLHERSVERVHGIRFCSPDRLVTITDIGQMNEVRLWQLGAGTLELQAATRIPLAQDPVVLPGRGQIAVCSSDGQVRLLDAANLMDRGALREFPGKKVRTLWNSADNRLIGAGGQGFAAVLSGGLGTAARCPPVQWVVADLRAVADAARDSGARPATRHLLDVLQAYMEYRLGTEVAIGAATPMAARADDIGLAAGGERPC